MLKLFLRRSSTKDAKPTVTKPAAAGELAQGELWLNNNHESPGLFARADDDSLIEFNPAKGVHVGETAPTAPKQGQQWFRSSTGKLYVYYDDGAGAAQWVVANPQEAVDYSRAVAKAGDTMTGNLTVPSLNGGQLAGFRNILINGNLKINQRGVPIAGAAAGQYGPDRWKKVGAGNMTQIVEDGNFVHGATYTLSGTGVTTRQLTAPASGHWTLPNIPITATNIQLEQGVVATPYEHRSYGLELMLCQRYFFVVYGRQAETGINANNARNGAIIQHSQTYSGNAVVAVYSYDLPVIMRATPTILPVNYVMHTSGGSGDAWATANPIVSQVIGGNRLWIQFSVPSGVYALDFCRIALFADL